MYWRADLTADMIILNKKREVLLIKRAGDPFKNEWVFTGGFLDKEDESLMHTVVRETREEIGSIITGEVMFFKVADKKERDPRSRVISHVFYTYVDEDFVYNKTEEAKDVRWFNLDELPSMGFDHEIILRDFLDSVVHDLGEKL